MTDAHPDLQSCQIIKLKYHNLKKYRISLVFMRKIIPPRLGTNGLLGLHKCAAEVEIGTLMCHLLKRVKNAGPDPRTTKNYTFLHFCNIL